MYNLFVVPIACRAAIYLWLSTLFFSCASSSVEAQVIESKEGDLDNLVRIISKTSQDGSALRIIYVFKAQQKQYRLSTETYYSSNQRVSQFDGKCVLAVPAQNHIVCDLNLVDSLLRLFGLMPHNPSKNQEQILDGHRTTLTKWIIAHEIGHIAKGHGVSDFVELRRGMLVFDQAQQTKELEADQYAVEVIGSLDSEVEEYKLLMEIANNLIKKALCPNSFPKSCAKIHPGVGLIFNSATDEPIPISGGGQHPEFIARFLRIIYLAGKDNRQNSINYLAKQAIDKFVIERTDGQWVAAGQALNPSE